MMNIVAVDEAKTNATPLKTKADLEQPAPRDKYDEVRKAKKKEKRARHRARLKRSNTDG
ncbi:MAG TPA: hypothetical protein VIW67_03840 [Terriglobales bacterium]|jgi:hypothetical protein